MNVEFATAPDRRRGDALARGDLGEGRQNLLCAYLAGAVLIGLLANTLFGIWWLDPSVGLGVAVLALKEGRSAWRGETATQLARSALAPPVACRFDDFTADVGENRYLRAALRLALRAPRVPAVDRRRLLGSLAVLEDVADVTVAADALERIAQTRLNAYYWPALRLARLVLENLTLRDVRGSHSASAFLVDMNVVFERFLTQRLSEELRGRLRVQAQAATSLDRFGRIALRPDLVFYRGADVVHVADIKYKLAEAARGRQEDYYHLLAYTTALALPEGVLIYCRTRDDQAASSARVVHGGPLLHIRAIDASGSPAAVAAEVSALADWLADRAGRDLSIPGPTLSAIKPVLGVGPLAESHERRDQR